MALSDWDLVKQSIPFLRAQMDTRNYFSVLAAVFLTSLQCDEAKPVCGGCSRHKVTVGVFFLSDVFRSYESPP